MQTRRSCSSRTAPDHDLRVRFFTPRTEASFVGHATVATHFVLSREGAPALHAHGSRRPPAPAPEVGLRRRRSARLGRHAPHRGAAAGAAARPPAQRSRAPRGARRAGPIHRRHRHALPAAHRRRRGHAPHHRRAQHRAAEQLKPDYSRLTTLSAQLGAAGFFVFTLSHGFAGCLTESRMFCPALGIPEDPVSGNAHGLLGAYLAEQGLLPHAGATAKFTGAQGHHVHRAGPRRRGARVQRRQARRRVDRRPGRLDLRNRDGNGDTPHCPESKRGRTSSSAARTCSGPRPRPPPPGCQPLMLRMMLSGIIASSQPSTNPAAHLPRAGS